MWNGWHGHMSPWFWPMDGFHGFWGLALVVGVVVLAVFLLRRAEPSRPDPALAILARRYAAGELSAEDYARMKGEIQG